MRSNSRILITGLLGFILGLTLTSAASAQAPAPPVPTIWDKLGMTGGLSKLRNNTINKNGNHPDWEKKPPLKTIADPANLDPKMPKAIQAAAAIKQQEDLAPQKIKAIKYLATMGCGCYQKTVDVRGALLEALDDCTEEVRYEAALAMCQVAGTPCAQCGGTCCNAESMNKLQEHASGKDANGCFKESSERVRNAAQAALDACRRKTPPGLEEVAPLPPHQGEMPTPIPQPSGEHPSGVREMPAPIQPEPQLAPPSIPGPPTDFQKPSELPANPVKPAKLSGAMPDIQPAMSTSLVILDSKPVVLDSKPNVYDTKPDAYDTKPVVVCDAKPVVCDAKPVVCDAKPAVSERMQLVPGEPANCQLAIPTLTRVTMEDNSEPKVIIRILTPEVR